MRISTGLFTLLLSSAIFICGTARAMGAEDYDYENRVGKSLRTQILLDRANLSPGEIDGKWGKNARGAMQTFQQVLGLEITESPNESTISELQKLVGKQLFQSYQITNEDTAGPFIEHIPSDIEKQTSLTLLAYTSMMEMLGERFHCSPELLQNLNPESRFQEGDTIRVPNIPQDEELFLKYPRDAFQGADAPTNEQTTKSTSGDSRRVATIVVSKSKGSLNALDSNNKLLLYAPVTSGSEHDPLPLGEWKVNGVDRMPSFLYNPKLFWDANPAHSKAKIPPGPNNPVGVVWIDLSKEHYGLHGTPEPSNIGYTQSHGCVRLTNWDATFLARMVRPGVKVLFVE
jgi:lipoprotein-anchoring transpeptidase ErfK/SrfK